MAACFHQGSLGHAAWTPECHVPKSFYERLDGFSLSLLSCQKGGHRDFRVILEEACYEKLLQIAPVLDRTFWELHEPFKGQPFQGADEQARQDGIIIYYIPSLGFKVVDMLIG